MASSPVFLPGELHGQRSLAGYSPWGGKQSDTTELLTLGRDQRCPHGALLRPAEARWSMQPVPRAGPAQQTPQKQPALKTVFTRRGSGGQCPPCLLGLIHRERPSHKARVGGEELVENRPNSGPRAEAKPSASSFPLLQLILFRKWSRESWAALAPNLEVEWRD